MCDYDRDQIAENVASNISTLYGTFIQLWKGLETILIKAGDPSGSIRVRPVGMLLKELHANGVIDDDQLNEGLELNSFRNRLLHSGSTEIEEQDIRTNIVRLESFTKTIRHSWKDEIVEQHSQDLSRNLAGYREVHSANTLIRY